MSQLIHRAFLFNANEFIQELEPIINSLDAGDARPLFKKAVHTISQTTSKEWIFRLAGTYLLDIRQVDVINQPWVDSIENRLTNPTSITSSNLGYWLLIVFSKFTQRCIGIGHDFPIIEGATRISGWTEDDSKLLISGDSTSLLLKPHEPVITNREYIKHTDPYWHWMIPFHAPRRGYLTQKRITYLFEQLQRIEQKIFDFNPINFLNGQEGYWSPIAASSLRQHYYQRLQATYKRALKMLEAALDEKKELYLTVSHPTEAS